MSREPAAKDLPNQTSGDQPVLPADLVEPAAEEVETLHASIKIGTVAQIVIALVATIGLLYLLKLVGVTILASILLAYVLEPPVAALVRIHGPRWVGAMVVTTLTVRSPWAWSIFLTTARSILRAISPVTPLRCARLLGTFVAVSIRS